MPTPVQPTSSNTHISSNFGKLLEPGLRKIFFETYSEIPEQFSRIFKVNTSKKAVEHDYGLGAFGDWTPRYTNLSEVDYETITAGVERQYIHEAYTKGFMIERELYDDEQYRQINKFPAAMARAGRAFVEKRAASFINLATLNCSAIYDTKPLIATGHTLLDSAGTSSNLTTGALTDTNLKIALQMMGETVDEAGNLVMFTADTLLVPPALEFTAKELVQSAQKAGTNNNDINTLKGSLNVVVCDFLGAAAGGSDAAWYLLDSGRHELNFFWRTKPEFKWDEDFDTFVAKYRGYMRFSYGASDWRGIIGSVGGLTASATPVVTTPSAGATSVSVTTCVNGARLQLIRNGKIIGLVTASGTTASFTGINSGFIKSTDKISVVQTETGKAPTCSTVGTVA